MSTQKRRAWAGVLLVVLVPAIAFAAVEIFLRIDGIEGESTDAKHKNEIDVESWSWGATAGASKQGCGIGAATFVMKGAVSGPKLAAFEMQRRPIPSMVVDFRGERHMLRNVMLTNHQEVRMGDGSVRHSFGASFVCATHPGGANAGFPKVEAKIESPGGIPVGLLLPAVQKVASPPAPMTLAKLEIQGTQAILLVKKGEAGERALAEAFRSKQALPMLRIAGRTPNETWTFFDVTITGSGPAAAARARGGITPDSPDYGQFTLTFTKVEGPLSGFMYKAIK